MIELILKTYANLFMSVAAVALLIFSAGLVMIFKKSRQSSLDLTPEAKQAFASIAGDDVIATQLDLARAYIEADMKRLAKPILDAVIYQGSQTQKMEAKRLLNL